MSRENHIYEPDWSGRTDQLCSVNKPVIKKDALALVTGKPVQKNRTQPAVRRLTAALHTVASLASHKIDQEHVCINFRFRLLSI